jgi:hypothetical protein
VRHQLDNTLVADTIRQDIERLSAAESIDGVRMIESQAARAYWSAWTDVRIEYPRSDLRRVPEHWRTFGSRHSLLTGSLRLAVNPPNAILNYLYAVLESEAHLPTVLKRGCANRCSSPDARLMPPLAETIINLLFEPQSATAVCFSPTAVSHAAKSGPHRRYLVRERRRASYAAS